MNETRTIGNFEFLFAGLVQVQGFYALDIRWRRVGHMPWLYPSHAGKLFAGEVLMRCKRSDLLGLCFLIGPNKASTDWATYVEPPLH